MPKKIYKKTEKGLKEVGILPSLTEWNEKSNVGHTHAISDIENLQSKLDTIPSIKTLNTNNSSAFPVSSSESISGSGSINLHKVSKTGKFSDLSNRGEAFLSWGGQNFVGSYGPIDAAMIGDLGANRLAFMRPAGISVEYSRDSGTTWQDYGATDSQKLALTSTGANFIIGKADSSNKATERYMLRISLHTSEGQVYTQLNKFALYVSTNGSNGSYCTIRARTQNNYLNKVDKWVVFANKQSISGWSGWNIINTSTITTFGNTASSQYGEIQLIFGCTSGSTSYVGLQIQRLMGFGGVGWQTPSNRAKYGTIYSYDYNQGVVFPGALTTNGTFTSNAGTILSSVKSAGILGTDSSGKVYNNSSAYQPKGNYVTTDKAGTISATKTFSSTPVLSTLKNKKVLGTDANGLIEAHTLGISDITNLQTSLDGKASKSHTHAISDVTNLQSILNEKANSSHTHSISQITNLQTSLDGKASKSDLNNYQPKGNYVTTDTAQTITGRKTFNSPANVNGQEVATAIFKTSNGGQLIIGKEGPNSGTMLRFDQTAGTTRLQFRASATPGAMVWTQPEKGATLYFDLTNSAGVSTRTTLDARSGKIARTSDIGNGKITIQKNGTEVGSFTTNQSGSKTINLTLGIDDIHDLRSQLNGKQPSGAYAERQSTETITGNWTFTGTTNFNGTTKVNGNEIASKGYVDGIFDSKLNASEATNFAKFTKFDSDTLKMTGARLYRTSAGDAVDRSSMYGYSSQNTHGTTYTRFAGMATIGSSQAFIGYYQYTNNADGSGGEYIGNITLSNGRLARINGSLSSVNELTDAYAVLSDLNNKANKTHTHAISEITNLQTSLNGKADVGHGHAISEITNLQSKLDGKANASHTHTISQITNLQTTLDNKQNKIEDPCSFRGSNSNYVKLIRAGTNNYYVEIERGIVTYNGSTTQYPEIKVTFPREFNEPPTVIVSFAPTSNSTGTYEALKVINVTKTGFTVITRMSASISGGYFRVNWIAIYTV